MASFGFGAAAALHIRRSGGDHAIGGLEFAQSLLGERLLFLLLQLHLFDIDGGRGDPGPAGGLVATLLQILLDPVQGIARTADGGDHAAGHLLQLGLRFHHLGLGDQFLQFLDLGLGVLDGNIPRLDQLLVGFLGKDQLLPVLLQLVLNRLQFQSHLPGDSPVADLDVGGSLGGQFPLAHFQILDLTHQAFHETRMRCQIVVETGDLLAQILFFRFDQSPGIGLFESGYEQSKETTDQLGHSFKHIALLVSLKYCSIRCSESQMR